jgi:hypothetical protein
MMATGILTNAICGSQVIVILIVRRSAPVLSCSHRGVSKNDYYQEWEVPTCGVCLRLSVLSFVLFALSLFFRQRHEIQAMLEMQELETR